MKELLDNITDKLTTKPKLLTRYVDEQKYKILKDLNSFHKHIKYTVELEQAGKIPYLDALVNREDNSLKIKWYKKTIASDEY